MEEEEIAAYLRRNPGFFENYQDLLEQLQVQSGRGDRSITLQERHLEIQRDRVKFLELRMSEMVQNAEHNQQLVDRLIAWFVKVAAETDVLRRPEIALLAVREQFKVPACALRIWPVEPIDGQDWSLPINEDDRLFATGLTKAYCGANHTFSVAKWLDNHEKIKSIALVPLLDSSQKVFGLFVLGSHDKDRFRENMGSYILDHMASMASATLHSLVNQN